MSSSSVAAGLRPRARLRKAKPNIMGGARRPAGSVTSSAVTTPKPVLESSSMVVTTEPQKEIKSPPPVRRVVQLEISKPVQLSNEPLTNPQSAAENSNKSESTEPSDLPPTTSINVDARTKGASPKKSLPNLENVLQKTLPMSNNNNKKTRKPSARGGIENREKDEVTKVRHKKGQVPPERAKMTMFDLIYWNPISNPMTYEDDEHHTPLANKEASTSVLPTENDERLAEEAVDNPECIEEVEDGGAAEKVEESMPVPQVKIGPDGNIILDEQSLVIETTASKIDISSSPVVYGRQNNATYSSFRNKKQTKTWSDRETAKFYVALSSVGTDFSMMAELFPKRERKELKLKFKREEKFNRELVDRAIRDRQQFDLSIFNESEEELENLGEKLVENATKGRRKQGSGQERKKKPENGGQNGRDKEQSKRKQPRGKKRVMQDEDDSDYDEIDEACATESESTDILSQQQDVHQGTLCDKEAVDGVPVESTITEATLDAEESLTEKENSDDAEMLKGVLKQTRSGRQPKKRALFTILNKEPKKRAKKSKPDDILSVLTPTEDVTTCTSTIIAPQDVSGEDIATTSVCTNIPHPFNAQVVQDEKVKNNTCTIVQPETPSCAAVIHEIADVESREIDLADTTCNNYTIADDKAMYEDDEQEEENCQEYKILEGVLKQTRSGRQPKMKPRFTIDNSKHKKETKDTGSINQVISPTKVTHAYSPLVNPLPNILANSPDDLYVLAEKPAEDGSQVVHLYLRSPPLVQPSVGESPTSSDHDYVLQNLANLPVNLRETTAE